MTATIRPSHRPASTTASTQLGRSSAVEDRRHGRNQGNSQHHEDDRTEGEGQGQQSALHEAAFVLLVVGDIDRGDQVADTAGCAPQRQSQREQKSQTQRPFRRRRQRPAKLVFNQLLGLAGQSGAERLQCSATSSGSSLTSP